MGFTFRPTFLGFVLRSIVAALCMLLVFGPGQSNSACVSQPVLLASQTFVPNTGCTSGSTYNTATARCHCWANCQVKKGYVCDLIAVPPTPTTAVPPTSSSCTGKAPALLTGETWTPSSGCPQGGWYNVGSNRCHCWSFCGYICGAPPTAAPPTGTPSTRSPGPTPTPTPTTAAPGTSKAYQIQARDLHNQLRAKHGSPALTLDSNLNALAEQCAVYYAQIGLIDHSCPYKAGAGENLIGGQGSWTQSEFATMGPTMWYDEISLYNYANPGFSLATGHFTQVVWKSSTALGYGVATVNGYTAGVGLYSPPGNIQGQFPQNVLPPTTTP